MAFSLGGDYSSSKSKTHSWIDPRTSAAQWANYGQAKQLAPTYTPTSPELIAQYANPYSGAVVDQSLAALDRSRRMAVNGVNDQAAAAHAFGGSRHGVAEALTNAGYADQAAQMTAQLYNQGWAQSLQAAQAENAQRYAYPLQRQAALNQSLGMITPETFGKTKGSNFGFGFNVGGK
jgi:hypothetical protein